ncbi:MAG: MgtC/SapB family protein, partial [Brevundimonas sp.]|uniref:MgtC/SapB family protein n=1 Tax=Brevundimonas sp. TaxID=1871086 RepID=UPI002ABD078F
MTGTAARTGGGRAARRVRRLLPLLAVAAGLGLLLGLDRELRGHAAGLRTHGLVCFTAAAMTVSI